MFTLAATVVVLLVASPQTARTGTSPVLLAGAACLLDGVVAGVIGLRWHCFTDTVADAGIGTLCGLALLVDLSPPRRRLFPKKHVSILREHVAA